MSLPVLTVKPGREKPLLRRHPWIFSGAILREPSVEPGEVVDVYAPGGGFLARAYHNVHSKIRARVLTLDPREAIDAAFFERRIAAALARRAALFATGHDTAARLVMSEADRLPGLIVDKYGDYLVMQALTAGIDRQVSVIKDVLERLLKPRGIIERSDDNVRELEGLPLVSRLLSGDEPADGVVEIKENGLTFGVELRAGHKTGFYLDQRRNHLEVRGLAQGKDVLDCFCYTGGFTVNAAAGGARSVLSLDASGPALARLQANLAVNGFSGEQYQQQEGNAFDVLRRLKDEGRTFDMIVLDPPKFAAHFGQIDKAARGYKDINLLAFKMLRPGGYLATFSCSGHISQDLFQKIIFGAAVDAGADAQIVQYLAQASDHPVLLSFPESLYLKGLLLRVV